MIRAIFLILVFFGLLPAVANGDELSNYRQPTALVLNEAENRILTANSKSGSISVVDLGTGEVREHEVGGSLRDMVRISGNRFLTVDFDRHQLIEFDLTDDGQIEILARIPVEKYPHRIAANHENGLIYVSSLWSRRISCFQRTVSTEPSQKPVYKRVATIDTEFAPREMVFLPDENKLIVGGNYRGTLAVINCKSNRIESTHQTTGHNIRGLGIAGESKSVLVSHQMLNELAHTSRNDIHWGLLMSNDLRWIKREAFFKSDSELYKSSHMHPLGKEGRAAGDPGRLSFAKDGTVVVTISGTNEVAFGKEDDFYLTRLKVGHRPVDVTINSTSQYAYIANSFEDSISVLDLQKKKIKKTISLGKIRPLTDLEVGEQLFFDASLSHDGWMSCHSCHTDGHTNNGLNDNFTDESFGAPKRVLSLLGRRGTEPLAWSGKVDSFETQVRNSIRSTMKSADPPEEKTVKLLAAFVRSLPPPPSLAEARGKGDTEAIKLGKKLFKDFGCVNCHQPPSFTSPETYDVGLKDEFNQKQFNPPSLLGVSQRSRFFHDGRAKSLDDVLSKYRHKIPAKHKADDLKNLRAFLESL